MSKKTTSALDPVVEIARRSRVISEESDMDLSSFNKAPAPEYAVRHSPAVISGRKMKHGRQVLQFMFVGFKRLQRQPRGRVFTVNNSPMTGLASTSRRAS